MKVITISNQKGGVCKTTNAFHLLCYLAEQGHRVLGVDLDPQGHLSRTLLGGEGCSTGELFRDKKPLIAAQRVSRSVPELEWSVTVDVTTSDASLWGYAGVADRMGGHLRLRQALAQSETKWDYVVVDCPCGLNGFTNNGLAAATHILVPSIISRFSEDGLKEILEYIEDMRVNGINSDFQILGILINQHDTQAKRGVSDVAKEGYQVVRERYGTFLVRQAIPKSWKVEEAGLACVPVWIWNRMRLREKDKSVEKIGGAYERAMCELYRKLEGDVSHGEGTVGAKDPVSSAVVGTS